MIRTKGHIAMVVSSALLLLVAVTSLSQSTASQPRETPPTDSGSVVFDAGQVSGNRFAVRAFVPTGSLSRHCLATLSESNFAMPGWVGLSSARKIRREPGSTMVSFQRERNGALLGGPVVVCSRKLLTHPTLLEMAV